MKEAAERLWRSLTVHRLKPVQQQPQWHRPSAGEKNFSAKLFGPLPLAFLLAAGLTLLWTRHLPLDRVRLGQNDFLGLYAGAKLVGTPLLYSAAAVYKLQEDAAGISLPAVLYSRPPFYAALLRPVAALPYREAYFDFEGLNLAALFAFLWFGARRDKFLWVLGGISIPVATAIANGQDVFLLLLICLGGWKLEQRHKSFWSGLVFSLLAIKFHFFLFIPIALLLRKRWKMLAGTATGGVALFAGSAWLQGWDWPVVYLKFLRMPGITPAPFPAPNLHGLLSATTGDPAIVELLFTALIALALIWITLRTPDLGPALALAVVAGLLTSYHAYIQDACLLQTIPVFAPRLNWSRRIALSLLAPPLYFLLMADGPLSAALPLGIVALFVAMAWENLRSETPRLATSVAPRKMYA